MVVRHWEIIRDSRMHSHMHTHTRTHIHGHACTHTRTHTDSHATTDSEKLDKEYNLCADPVQVCVICTYRKPQQGPTIHLRRGGNPLCVQLLMQASFRNQEQHGLAGACNAL